MSSFGIEKTMRALRLPPESSSRASSLPCESTRRRNESKSVLMRSICTVLPAGSFIVWTLHSFLQHRIGHVIVEELAVDPEFEESRFVLRAAFGVDAAVADPHPHGTVMQQVRQQASARVDRSMRRTMNGSSTSETVIPFR